MSQILMHLFAPPLKDPIQIKSFFKIILYLKNSIHCRSVYFTHAVWYSIRYSTKTFYKWLSFLQRGRYNYWQAFGSDGMAGLYDFVKRAPGERREIRSSYGSFGGARNVQPSYDRYSSSWYKQPEIQRYSQPRTSYSRGYSNRAPYSNVYYGNSASPPVQAYVSPRQTNKKKTYQYWQGFGSDGLAGLYDFVKKWAAAASSTLSLTTNKQACPNLSCSFHWEFQVEHI